MWKQQHKSELSSQLSKYHHYSESDIYCGSEWQWCVCFVCRRLTCDQWGCKQLKDGWNSTPGTESWSDKSGLNSSRPLAAGPLRLCKVRETEKVREVERSEERRKWWRREERCDDILNHFLITEKLPLFRASVRHFNASSSNYIL